MSLKHKQSGALLFSVLIILIIIMLIANAIFKQVLNQSSQITIFQMHQLSKNRRHQAISQAKKELRDKISRGDDLTLSHDYYHGYDTRLQLSDINWQDAKQLGNHSRYKIAYLGQLPANASLTLPVKYHVFHLFTRSNSQDSAPYLQQHLIRIEVNRSKSANEQQ
ncbi:hypothetical protein E2K93_03060 [Thalassotalea sp. HSM 43]|uniref:hypothetical protein n=1 Tax=Thalassotalea sp. HSM 43 TaxID=2552945 RepID=UPI0010800AD3|nr:hypothetical protein [Thalassotalea sp. HSM 43]QBY03413.1 hypothetical protein E2K93_03060 [Thalassotalea sp. HSM 43]